MLGVAVVDFDVDWAATTSLLNRSVAVSVHRRFVVLVNGPRRWPHDLNFLLVALVERKVLLRFAVLFALLHQVGKFIYRLKQFRALKITFFIRCLDFFPELLQLRWRLLSERPGQVATVRDCAAPW